MSGGRGNCCLSGLLLVMVPGVGLWCWPLVFLKVCAGRRARRVPPRQAGNFSCGPRKSHQKEGLKYDLTEVRAGHCVLARRPSGQRHRSGFKSLAGYGSTPHRASCPGPLPTQVLPTLAAQSREHRRPWGGCPAVPLGLGVFRAERRAAPSRPTWRCGRLNAGRIGVPSGDRPGYSLDEGLHSRAAPSRPTSRCGRLNAGRIGAPSGGRPRYSLGGGTNSGGGAPSRPI